jgi:NADH-quinone oxidoreductase subunit N
MIYNINFDPFLDSIFLFSSIIVLIIFSCFFTVSKKNNFILVNNIIGINFILFLVLFILLIINNPFTNVCSFSGTIINDLSSIYCKMVTVISSILCFYLSFSYIKNYQINHFEFFIIIGIAIFSLNLLVISHDFLIAYISIELQSLSFYIMACFKRQSAYSTESGIKYFLLGSFSSTILLFGISLIYGLFGTLNFHLLNLLIFEFNYLFFLDKIGFILIFIGLLFKLSAAPFHFWLPDVYEGAPIISTVFFAVVPKISILILIFKILIIYFHNNIILLFLLSSILSIIIGSFVALKQKRLKKLLAYSSINHIGYLLFGIALFSIESICATFFYVLTYMITGLCI